MLKEKEKENKSGNVSICLSICRIIVDNASSLARSSKSPQDHHHHHHHLGLRHTHQDHRAA